MDQRRLVLKRASAGRKQQQDRQGRTQPHTSHTSHTPQSSTHTPTHPPNHPPNHTHSPRNAANIVLICTGCANPAAFACTGCCFFGRMVYRLWLLSQFILYHQCSVTNWACEHSLAQSRTLLPPIIESRARELRTLGAALAWVSRVKYG